MRHFSVAALFIALSLVLAGCFGSSDTTPPSFNGKWVIFLNSATEFPPPTEFDMNLQRARDVLSSDNANTIDNIGCVPAGDTVGDRTQGNIKGNQFILGLAIDNRTPNAQGIRFTGTVSKNRATITGTCESDPGICFEGETGIFTADFVAPLTGNYAGNLVDTNTSSTSNVTGTLTEA
jgi:hypothetical protein